MGWENLVEFDCGKGAVSVDKVVEIAVALPAPDVALEGTSDSSGHSNNVPVLSGSSEAVALAGTVVLAGGKGTVVLPLLGHLVVVLIGHGIVVLADGHGALVVVVVFAIEAVGAVKGPSEPVSTLWPDVTPEMVTLPLPPVCDGVGIGCWVRPVPLSGSDTVTLGMGNGIGTAVGGTGIPVTGGKVMVVFSSVIGGSGPGTPVSSG